LLRTEVLDGPCSVSPLDLFAWLAELAPDPVAVHLVGLAARTAGLGMSLAG
jgi:hypothetical protein